MSLNVAKYEATVTWNEDPDKLGKIRVSCVGLMGDEETEIPIDVDPVHDWGWFYVPDVGEIVEIEVIEGSSEDEQNGQMSIDNLDIKWRSKRFFGNTEGDTPTPINEDFTSTNYGKRRGFATPMGHVFMFDDTEGSEQVSLKWQNKAGENTFFSMDKDGSIIMSNKTGTTLFFNASAGEMSIIDQHGNLLSSDSNGIKLIDATGKNIVELKAGAIQILGGDGVTVSCKDAVLDAGKVQIGGQPAIQPIIMGTLFLTAMTTWTTALTTVLGTCVPSPPTGLAAFTTATATLLTQLTAALSTQGFVKA